MTHTPLILEVLTVLEDFPNSGSDRYIRDIIIPLAQKVIGTPLASKLKEILVTGPVDHSNFIDQPFVQEMIDMGLLTQFVGAQNVYGIGVHLTGYDVARIVNHFDGGYEIGQEVIAKKRIVDKPSGNSPGGLWASEGDTLVIRSISLGTNYPLEVSRQETHDTVFTVGYNEVTVKSEGV